jgi:4-hydroxyphenylpyruvate dioxygenase
MKIDHIHFYVRDASRMRDWLIQKMGFQSDGQQITEHTQTEIVRSGEILFHLSAALSPFSPVTAYLGSHPEGVVDIAFLVDDLAACLTQIDRWGAQIMAEVSEPELGKPQQLTIQGWGDYCHTLIESSASSSSVALLPEKESVSMPLIGIDHVVLNVHQDQLAAAATWYQNIFGLEVQQTFDIQTGYSGLYSQALVDTTNQVQFNINEPSSPNSQIQTFLDIYGGAGIQHIALRTTNIFQVVTEMRSHNLEFLPIPPSYYTNLQQRAAQTRDFAFTDREWQDLAATSTLLDWSVAQPHALLMQIFTQPIFEQPTFFFEIIERRQQAPGFGAGNFLALFQAMEQAEINSLI